MTDTKINILRNLMVPVVNYFLLHKKDVLIPREEKLLKASLKLSIKNIEEICDILGEIPENACEETLNSESSHCFK